MGRPLGSGYASQVKLLQKLRFADQLSFQQLIHLTKLHRNTVANNLKILADKELVKKPRRGRYRIVDEDSAWRYIEEHSSDLKNFPKHPAAKRVSRITYECAVRASKPSLRRYIFELSKYPDGKPYGLQGIKAARILRSHLRDKNRRVLLTSGIQRSQTTPPVSTKTPLGLTHLLHDSAWFRLAQGKGDDVDWVIMLLTHLTRYKWQQIELPELSYLREATPEEEALYGQEWAESMKRYEESRHRIQAEYAKWKKHEEDYVLGLKEIPNDVRPNVIENGPLTFLDRKGNIIRIISYFDFKAGTRTDFSNWKREIGKTKANRLIDICRKHFKDPPRHFLDWLRDRVAHANSIYAEAIWFVSQKYKEELQKLADLGVLERINPDMVRPEDFRKYLREDQLVIDPAARLKALQEIMSPFRLTLQRVILPIRAHEPRGQDDDLPVHT